MSKVVFRTSKPDKGFVNHKSFMSHETKGLYDKLPEHEIQKHAHRLISESMSTLIKKLKELGYDETRASFYIHY